jgi:hypothetical protein
MKIKKPLTPKQLQKEFEKERARAEALAAYEAKCMAMDINAARVAAIVGVTVRQVMQAQIAAIDADTEHFNGNRRWELVRQLRELDGLD